MCGARDWLISWLIRTWETKAGSLVLVWSQSFVSAKDWSKKWNDQC